MLKPLLKKQLLELKELFFKSGKSRKVLTKGSTAGFIALYIFVAILLFFSVGAIFTELLDGLTALDLRWLYFAIGGVGALLAGTLGSAFTTYSGLYRAKDNELLLSLPIKPKHILFARMTMVYATGMIFSGLVYLPMFGVHIIFGSPTVLSVIVGILLYPVSGFAVLALSCLLGWLVALLSVRLKNKSYITALLSVVFLAIYFVVYYKIQDFILEATQYGEEVAEAVKTYGYPFYLFGKGMQGELLPALGVLAISALLFILVYAVLSANFIRITTTDKGSAKKTYKKKSVKEKGIFAALLRKEAKHFISSATCMLNCGIGSLMMVGMGIFLLVKSDVFDGLFEALPEISGVASVFGFCAILFFCGTNCLTASSISLEGKSLWLLQSLPVETSGIFKAKLAMKYLITLPGAWFLFVAEVFALEIEPLTALAGFAAITLAEILFGIAGLLLNLRFCNLDWANETAAVKQGNNVMLAVFGAMGFSILFGVGGYFACKVLAASVYLLIVSVLLLVVCIFLYRCLMTSGDRKFKEL